MAEGGRPTDYRPEFIEAAKSICENGGIDRDLARAFGVHVSTVYAWKVRYPEFREATKIAKDIIDDAVENALLQRALGYSFEAEKIFMAEGKPVRVPFIEHYPPSDVAAIFWLKNRRPDKWRERKEDVQNLSETTEKELKTTAQRLRGFARELEELSDGDNSAETVRPADSEMD